MFTGLDAAAPTAVWDVFERRALSPDGTVLPLEGPGLGVNVDEDYLRAHPLTEGPAWR